MPQTFHYKLIERPKPLEPAKAPTVVIRLKGKKHSIDFVAIVDSGSDKMIIPKKIAEILKLKLVKKKREDVFGLGGHVEGIPVNVEATIKYEYRRITLVLHTLVVDSDIPLLIGRQDFFERFEVTFNERKRTVRLKDLGRT